MKLFRPIALVTGALALATALPATAQAADQTLSVTKHGPGTGTVKSSPAGIECGPECQAPFAEGMLVTLAATPGPNTDPTVQWSGCDAVAAGKCEVTMSSARSVSATFNLVKHELKVSTAGPGTGTVKSSPAGINCGATCSAQFSHGEAVILSVTPGPNTDPVPKWTGCGIVTPEGKCEVTMSAAKSVTATFELVKLPLSLSIAGEGAGTVSSSPAGLSCTESCAHSFTLGQLVALTATPDSHSQPALWSGCESIGKKGECLVTMSSAKEVSALFVLKPEWVLYDVGVRIKGTGTGSVVSFPAGIACPGDCEESFLFQTALTLVATPASGSEFDHWSGGSCSGAGACERNVNSNRLINAVFDAVGNRTLTVSKQGTGQGTVQSTNVAGIDCGSVCSAELDAATKVTLKATPAPGSTFAGFSGAGCFGTAACHVTMSEARNVTATFTKPPPGPSELLVAGRARVKAGSALLRLACEGASPCNGSLRLLLKVRNAQGQTKGLVIAQGSYELAPGARQTLSLKLSSRARRLLGGAESLRARVTGTGIDSHAVRLSA